MVQPRRACTVLFVVLISSLGLIKVVFAWSSYHSDSGSLCIFSFSWLLRGISSLGELEPVCVADPSLDADAFQGGHRGFMWKSGSRSLGLGERCFQPSLGPLLVRMSVGQVSERLRPELSYLPV